MLKTLQISWNWFWSTVSQMWINTRKLFSWLQLKSLLPTSFFDRIILLSTLNSLWWSSLPCYQCTLPWDLFCLEWIKAYEGHYLRSQSELALICKESEDGSCAPPMGDAYSLPILTSMITWVMHPHVSFIVYLFFQVGRVWIEVKKEEKFEETKWVGIGYWCLSKKKKKKKGIGYWFNLQFVHSSCLCIDIWITKNCFA